ncbi:MAG: bifunctional phosphoserine phosphatase/homoserine phosphotransferase ThrH [Pseudomonadales bacterium]
MQIVCLDLESILIPEIWIEFAQRTGIEELRATTREVPDYDVLMRQRLRLLNEHQLGLKEIQAVIAEMEPLTGAVEFLEWLRPRYQVVIISDTFYEFSQPLMQKLGWPTLLAHHLVCDDNERVVDYKLRQTDPKRHSVIALQQLDYQVIAVGDSHNDISMLEQADTGILFNSPDAVKAAYPQFPVTESYEELKEQILKVSS